MKMLYEVPEELKLQEGGRGQSASTGYQEIGVNPTTGFPLHFSLRMIPHQEVNVNRV